MDDLVVNADDVKLCDLEINDLHKTINDQQADADKQLLSLSSGLIVLSLAFTKDIAPREPVFVKLLIIGLILIMLCIIGVLFSYRWSIAGLEKAKLYWERRRSDTYGDHSFPSKHAKVIKGVNVATSVLFGLGLFSIGLFVTVNITQEMKMSKQIAQDGATIKLISPKRNDSAGSTVKSPVPPPPPPPKSK